MEHQSSTVEQILARIAGRSHGVVTRAEALRAGVTHQEIVGRLQAGSLIRVHRGVYRVGHAAPSLEARYMAAVRACGPEAALSGLAAAHLLGLTRSAPGVAEVTAPAWRRVEGVAARRVRALDPADRTTWRGIPVTTVGRTLVDLARVLAEDDLARACHEAGVRHGTTPRQVEAVLDRRPRAAGAASLRRVIGGDVRVTLSRLESRFLHLLAARGWLSRGRIGAPAPAAWTPGGRTSG